MRMRVDVGISRNFLRKKKESGRGIKQKTIRAAESIC